MKRTLVFQQMAIFQVCLSTDVHVWGSTDPRIAGIEKYVQRNIHSEDDESIFNPFQGVSSAFKKIKQKENFLVPRPVLAKETSKRLSLPALTKPNQLKEKETDVGPGRLSYPASNAPKRKYGHQLAPIAVQSAQFILPKVGSSTSTTIATSKLSLPPL